jgi:hypothetical protein
MPTLLMAFMKMAPRKKLCLGSMVGYRMVHGLDGHYWQLNEQQFEYLIKIAHIEVSPNE